MPLTATLPIHGKRTTTRRRIAHPTAATFE